MALGTPVLATASAGGLNELQTEISRDDLVVADGENEFQSAMEAMAKRPVGTFPRSSVLADRFFLSNVLSRYSDIIERAGGLPMCAKATDR